MSESNVPASITFLFGGIAGLGSAITAQPMDLVKNRMQMAGASKTHCTNSWTCARAVYAKEGLIGFYSGLSASIARQLTYTTSRLGIYNLMLERSNSTSFKYKMFSASVAGSIGAFIGSPSDLALVRMTLDKSLPKSSRRNYRSLWHVWSTIVAEDGIKGLWKGSMPTVYRAIIVNVSQLATFSQSKLLVKRHSPIQNEYLVFTLAALISGFVTSVYSLPVDFAKTRLQQQTSDYKGMVDILVKVSKNEGVGTLWKGFGAYYARTGPRTLVTLVINDSLIYNYKKFKRQ